MPGTWDITGEIYKLELDGTIIGKFGHASKEFGGFQVVHMMDCRNPDEIVVGEIESWWVQKLIQKPYAMKKAEARYQPATCHSPLQAGNPVNRSIRDCHRSAWGTGSPGQ